MMGVRERQAFMLSLDGEWMIQQWREISKSLPPKLKEKAIIPEMMAGT
jgi:hypothetical protein